MTLAIGLELLATLLNVLFVVYIIQQKRIGWVHGVVASLISIWLFIHAKLYAEALLYSYYVVVGVWAWWLWGQQAHQGEQHISRLNIGEWLWILIGGSLCTGILAWLLATYSDAERSLVDSLTTVFSFIATWLEAKRVLEAWPMWLILNLVSVWLYADRELIIYAGLMAFFALMSAWGWWQWRQDYQLQASA